MGGLGSGRTSWGTTTTDNVPNIDIRYLKRRGWLDCPCSGTLRWTRGGQPSGSVTATNNGTALVLNFKHRQHDDAEWCSDEQVVSYDRTPCNYGGRRTWFLCPVCSRRVSGLWFVRNRFACRNCQRLPYASQHEGLIDRMYRKAGKIRRRLGLEDITGDPSDKPKGMHWTTYWRLCDEEWQAMQTVDIASMWRFRSLLGS